ncbi:hypothetical protein O4H26_07115 [Aequorivita viscosa]|nr:hypothetical protein [Aequorivita viscosa]
MSNNSFENINYSLRPAKAVERKMISFALQKLNNFSDLSEYQYVGFGSTFFQDHIIFHKDLGISKLISIEKSGKKERFNFNKPYHCVEIQFGQATDILPKINWKDKTILWLDYDKIMKSTYLSDVATFFSSAISGSVFLLSLNVNPDSYGENNKKRKLKIEETLGEEKIPLGSKNIDFANNNLYKILKKIIDNEIYSTLSKRNGGLKKEDKFKFRPLFNFKYADGARMLTVGGILVKTNDDLIFSKANFQELSFIKTGADPFEIEIPSLTHKEIKFLNSQLPAGIDVNGSYVDSIVQSNDPLIPKNDIVNYSKIYKYFPVFTESLNF